jgi:primosomal protein N' (replication factor Y)
LAGEVIIQTAHPEHYALKHVVDHDYVNFYKEEIAFRASTHYPPLSRIILIEFKGKSETDVQTVSQLFGRELRSASFPGTVLGPAAAVISKINTNYRWHLLIKIDRERDKYGTLCRAAIKNSYKKISQKTQKEKVLITIDVDPAGTI